MKHLFSILFLLFSLYAITLPATAIEKADAGQAVAAETVNINTASPAQIANGLRGIGLSKAKAVVAYRDKNGPFKRAADLAAVKGIGKRTVERNQRSIRLK